MQLEERSRLWDPAFTAYYMSQCYPHADLNGKWSAIKFGWTGFTERANFVSNQSEHVKTKYLTFNMQIEVLKYYVQLRSGEQQNTREGQQGRASDV